MRNTDKSKVMAKEYRYDMIIDGLLISVNNCFNISMVTEKYYVSNANICVTPPPYKNIRQINIGENHNIKYQKHRLERIIPI